MASFINSDDGIISGVAGLKYGADSSGSLVLQTNGTTAITISAAQAVTFTGSAAFTTASFTNLSYTGTLTGGTGVVNIGSGQIYKDASGNVGIGQTSPVSIAGYTIQTINNSSTGSGVYLQSNGTTVGRILNTATEMYVGGVSVGSPLLFQSGGIVRMRVNAGAPILCLDGGNTSATGTGITFPATQSASSDANTLDDYEEGNWTPSQGGGLTVVGAFSSAGTYVKIGRVVIVTGRVTGATSVAVAASGIISSNLPFSSSTDALGCSNNNALTANSQCYVASANLIYNSTGITATSNIFFTITYYTTT